MSEPQSEGTDREKPAHRKPPAWIAGAVLIVVGLYFVARNITGFSLNNWWALFILIPASGSLAAAFRMYRRDGSRFTAASRGPLIGGLILLAVTAIFLFELNWGVAWPVFPILIGAGLILNSFGK